MSKNKEREFPLDKTKSFSLRAHFQSRGIQCPHNRVNGRSGGGN